MRTETTSGAAVLTDLQKKRDRIEKDLASPNLDEARLRELTARRSSLQRDWERVQARLAQADWERRPAEKHKEIRALGSVILGRRPLKKRTISTLGGLFRATGFVWKEGPDWVEMESPTYRMQVGPFRRFVEALETLAQAAAKKAEKLKDLAQRYPGREPGDPEWLIRPLKQWPGYAETDRPFAAAWRDFWPKYGKTFGALIREHAGAPCLSLHLYTDRTGERELLRRLVDAALKYRNCERLLLPVGRPDGPDAIATRIHTAAIEEFKHLAKRGMKDSLSGFCKQVSKNIERTGEIEPKTLHPILRPFYKKIFPRS